MRLITKDDLIDAYCRLQQRGIGFLSSKFTTDPVARTKSAFDETSVQASHWWKVPKVRSRWNELITGDPQMEYEPYFVRKYLRAEPRYRMLSLGSGSCSHELIFASFPHFEKITCVDIAENRLKKAERKAHSLGYDHMKFVCQDVHKLDVPPESYDVVLFHSALHHMYDVESLLAGKVKRSLSKDGLLVINEYVGPDRLQYPGEQIRKINLALKSIPKPYRKRFKTSLYKNSYHGSGWVRMVIADPSECADSSSILPSIHKHYKILEEKPYGGNLLMPVLKDIAHHFIYTGNNKEKVLDQLFELEDQYLERHSSDFLFGVYTLS